MNKKNIFLLTILFTVLLSFQAFGDEELSEEDYDYDYDYFIEEEEGIEEEEETEPENIITLNFSLASPDIAELINYRSVTIDVYYEDLDRYEDENVYLADGLLSDANGYEAHLSFNINIPFYIQFKISGDYINQFYITTQEYENELFLTGEPMSGFICVDPLESEQNITVNVEKKFEPEEDPEKYKEALELIRKANSGEYREEKESERAESMEAEKEEKKEAEETEEAETDGNVPPEETKKIDLFVSLGILLGGLFIIGFGSWALMKIKEEKEEKEY